MDVHSPGLKADYQKIGRGPSAQSLVAFLPTVGEFSRAAIRVQDMKSISHSEALAKISL
jgi:hypothetical protein